ncbi:MAG: alpha/beta hydrolase [Acidobacteria bacterium]|nr:alpha/beta hydrolase [Acidobacteriota bacterium]
MNRGIRGWATATLAGAMTALWCATASAAEAQAVTFTARDGVPVTGSLYLPEQQPAPAVVLLPMLSRSHHDWDATAAKLAESGIAALAIDFRRSGGPRAGDDFSDLVLDAQAARGYLAARPDIAPGRIGIVGASLGANVAVLAGANDPSVRTLVLLSPSMEYRNLRMDPALRTFGSRPVLLIASSEDPYALRTARASVTMGDGPRELRVLSGAGHGTVMLARDPDLATAVVDWLLRTLL